MVSLAVMFIFGFFMDAMIMDKAKAQIAENPERYLRDRKGLWGRLSQWGARKMQREGRFFRKDLTARQLNRMIWRSWLILGGVFLVTVPIDAALYGWEAALASQLGFSQG